MNPKQDEVDDLQAGGIPAVSSIPVVNQMFSRPQFPSTEAYVTFIKERDKMLTELRPIAVKATKPGQWQTYGETPRPDAGAAITMLKRCGGSVLNIYFERTEHTDDIGPYYIYTCYGSFILPMGVYFDALQSIGTCSSRDPFFGTKFNPETRKAEPKKLSEVRDDNVKKKAKANLIVNGTLDILALRGIDWPELESYGFRAAGSTKVDFKKNGKGGGATTGDGQKQKGDNPVVPEDERMPIIAEFQDLAVYLSNTDKYEDVDAVCKAYLPFRKADKQGNMYVTFQKVATFKYAKAMRWLNSAVEKIKAGENLEGFEAWMDDQEKGLGPEEG